MSAPIESPGRDDATPNNWTAAQIAVAAGLSRRWVLWALAQTQASCSVIVRGNETAAYGFDVLPPGIKERIAKNAGAAGSSVADYLLTVRKPWQPARGLAEIDAASIAEAKKWRAALLPALQRRDLKLLSAGEKGRRGLEDYKREFGHEITLRHWERLIERTLRRAGADPDLERLELYLPEHPKVKAEAQRLTPGESEFAELLDIIRAVHDPNALSDGEAAAVWAAAFELYDEAANPKRKKYLRRALVKFLWRHAPALASGQHALRVAFDWKCARWIEGGRSTAALLDGRREKRGVATAPEIPKGDRDVIIFHAAANCGGRVAQAVRDYAASGNRAPLSPETQEIISRPAARKSYVNRRLMKAVSNEVQQVMPFFLGKQAIDDFTASVKRDYSKLASMDVVSADDFTLPVYCYVPDGKGGFVLTRGQCLVFLDVRSWRIIAYSLQPDRNFNSLVIRTLMNRVCSDHGIPGTWYFERGIWKRSLLVNGRAPAGWNEGLSPVEAKSGWERLGVEFRYATRARVKTVERVGGMLQDLMHGERGYCGRDERRDCPVRTKRAMDDFAAGRFEHPGELFYSFQEWEERLWALVEKYNASSQDAQGSLKGLSPDEAFKTYWPESDPPAKLDERSWHLLAHYVRPVPVTENGVCFRIGQKQFVYRNARTGQDRGKTVLVWFDPESPEYVCITDRERKNGYLVERAGAVDFLAALGDPVLERELSKAAAHGAFYRARYRTLKATFEPAFRRNIVDAQNAATAQEFRRLRDGHEAKEQERSAAQKSFSRLGMSAPRELRPGQAEAAQELAAILGKPKLSSLSTDAKGQTVYQLKASGSGKTEYVDYLLTVLTDCRKKGEDWGQKFNRAVTFGMTRRIAEGQLKCSAHDEGRFDDVCAHLKEKIDATIEGKNNRAKGIPNYRQYETHNEKAAT